MRRSALKPIAARQRTLKLRHRLTQAKPCAGGDCLYRAFGIKCWKSLLRYDKIRSCNSIKVLDTVEDLDR